MNNGCALLFPGQGSQAVGMGSSLVDNFPVAAEVFAEADEALGFSLSRLCFEGPTEDLTLTENAQPAIVTNSIATLRVLQQETAMEPCVVAGHSLGEYSALVCADALDFADAVRLVRLRGQLMQQAVPKGVGSMAALIGVSEEVVNSLCEEAAQGEIVSVANLNGGGQIVIAGHGVAVRRVVSAAKEKKAKRAIELEVSAPFHCALMSPAADGVARALENVRVHDPKMGVVSNVTARANHQAGQVKELLVRQVTAPVRWEESMATLLRSGSECAVELGAGRVLTGLFKRFDKTFLCVSIGDPTSLSKGLESLGL